MHSYGIMIHPLIGVQGFALIVEHGNGERDAFLLPPGDWRDQLGLLQTAIETVTVTGAPPPDNALHRLDEAGPDTWIECTTQATRH